MTRRIFAYLTTLVAVTSVISYASPTARAENYVRITSPTGGDDIAEDPGSIGVSGNYLNSNARSITVSIYKAQLVDGGWQPTGGVLSSGSTAVDGTTLGSKSWAVNLNSPATATNVNYVLQAVSKNINGVTLDTSEYTHVISD